MDTSEQNIKMCEKAVKIQEHWVGMPEDFVAYKHILCGINQHHITTIWWIEKGSLSTEPYNVNYIWLPGQDKLQEMLQDLKGSVPGYNLAFLTIVGVVINANMDSVDYYWQFTSMEQLWLAFVMKEKYNKVWNGEDWIVEG